MQRAGAGAHPAQRGGQRIAVVYALGLEVAAQQAHRAAVEDVDCRVEPHRATAVRAAAQIPAKFASRRRPAADDFSGWNCTPKKQPRCTAVTNSSPYCATPSTSSRFAGTGANECT